MSEAAVRDPITPHGGGPLVDLAAPAGERAALRASTTRSSNFISKTLSKIRSQLLMIGPHPASSRHPGWIQMIRGSLSHIDSICSESRLSKAR